MVYSLETDEDSAYLREDVEYEEKLGYLKELCSRV